ncbi:hypothetical protein BDQ12DRAFT_721556 [Crucibulum laeve]|uniref:Uncharacterized protein n=1 Tax=Crucibulum laeve TaxID=68775 RepID=A0A5C3MFW8_9AGAR|nr:hypothetical protein BDQ12DRAFT_721556 [Crucibulum laeve]
MHLLTKQQNFTSIFFTADNQASLRWIPRHVNITSNETADTEAKDAISHDFNSAASPL